MIYICSYFVLLFTFQLILILKQAPSMWLLALWGLLFLWVYFYRQKFYYPPDHPFYTHRKRVILVLLGALLALMGSNIYQQVYFDKLKHSEIALYVKQNGGTDTHYFISGKINSELDRDGDRVRFLLRLEKIDQYSLKRKETIILTHYVQDTEELERFESLNRGDLWQGEASITRPRQARNPGAFDYRDYLFHQGIHFQGQAEGNWSSVTHTGGSSTLRSLLDKQRESWIKQVNLIFSAEIAPIVEAMTIGEKDKLSPKLMESYQQLGLIHVLAISGLHVGIILWSLYYLLLQLPLTKERVLGILFCFIPLYIYLSGAQVAVIRAGLMGMIALLFLRFNFWKQSVLTLYFVYILMLFWNPFYLFQVGFQLSFAVTYFLLTAYTPVKDFLHFLPDKLGSAMSIAFIAQLVSIPILLLHFYQFSPFSFGINLLLVPVYSLIFIPGAFILTLISFIDRELTQFGVYVYEKFLQSIHKGLDWVLELPYATIHTGQPSLWWIVIWIGTTVCMLIQMEKNNRRVSGGFLLLLPIWLTLLVYLPYLDRTATITMLDVGQGEAIVIELPYREEVILIDLGGQVSFPKEEWRNRQKEYEVGRDTILPYLRYRGINQIDKIVISHGHYDHFGGIQGLLGKIKIKQLLRSSIPPHSNFEREWLMNMYNLDIPIYGVQQGYEWKTKHSLFHVVYPDKKEKNGQEIENIHDYNVVLWNQIYGTTFLWTGDLEEEGELSILDRYQSLDVDFLKVAHHGSLTSTSETWLEQLRPKSALLSVGNNNRYRLPNEDIIERLNHRSVDIYRTDLYGGIVIKVTPKQVITMPTIDPKQIQGE